MKLAPALKVTKVANSSMTAAGTPGLASTTSGGVVVPVGDTMVVMDTMFVVGAPVVGLLLVVITGVPSLVEMVVSPSRLLVPLTSRVYRDPAGLTEAPAALAPAGPNLHGGEGGMRGM